MRVPLSWLRDFVEVDLDPVELARLLTFAGLEVEGIEYAGLPLPPEDQRRQANVTGMEWDPETVVVGYVKKVEGHPQADRLVLAHVDDGTGTVTSVTGAPNLLRHRDEGKLDRPLPVALARSGARLRNPHEPDGPLITLETASIRGVESTAMACSERELGISDEHEGVLLLDDDAPAAGTPLAEVLGDVVLDISLTPNLARNASILGVAREVAALTGKPLRLPDLSVTADGPPVGDKVRIEIGEPRLNPRFTATLIEGVEIGPSPLWIRRRLRLAGMRPVSNVVDATNYVMLELGQPLHAFDYDVLVERAGGDDAVPTIVTRLPEPGERLTTLDGEDRPLDDFTILVADGAGALSLGGVMGGSHSEVSDGTRRVLLESAAWDFINIRRTVQAQRLSSEAGYRFSRGVHPQMALRGNLRGIELMRQLTGGTVCAGVVDEYPAPAPEQVVELPLEEIERLLGLAIAREEVVRILEALEFGVESEGDTLRVTVPDHRLDIGTGTVGRADLIEEIARIHGYERIPETQISDTIPPQRGNRSLEAEEAVRDLLVQLGLQEVVTYRLTSAGREARLTPGEQEDRDYVTLAKPISEERAVLRRSLLTSLLEAVQENVRVRDSLRLFEIGPVYLPEEGEKLPAEPRRLCLAMTGLRQLASWADDGAGNVDFYDLKGVIDALLDALHLEDRSYAPTSRAGFHPGRSAALAVAGHEIGVLGELHPDVQDAFELTGTPVLAAELDFERLFELLPEGFEARPVPRFPPLIEDLAIVVDDDVPAAELERLLVEAGGAPLAELQLFDLYRGEQIGSGRKSLAYRLTFQSDEGTLTDEDAARIRSRILERLERELGAELRS